MTNKIEHTKNLVVKIEEIQVNTLENYSGIFVGETSASGWSSSCKLSTFFKVRGDQNIMIHNQNVGFDSDLTDTYIK